MNKYLPAAAAAATGVFVGSTMVATRFVIEQSSPASLALLRYLIGFLCLLPPTLMAARVRFARHDLLPIAVLGIMQFGIVITLLNYALQYIPSARAALIFATVPLQTMLLAALLGHERMTLAKSSGVLLTIAGVGLALGDKVMAAGDTPAGWLGELAVLGSALSAAVCSVLYRPYLRKYPTLPVSAYAMFASVAFLALPAAGEGFFAAFPEFTSLGWLAVIFIGTSSGIGYYLWLWALNNTTPTKVTVFLSLSPVTAALLGAFLLGETLTPLLILGVGCVVLGLWLAHWQGG